MQHRFRVGEMVYLIAQRPNLPSGLYMVEGLLPDSDVVLRYQVKNAHGEERVVRQGELVRVGVNRR